MPSAPKKPAALQRLPSNANNSFVIRHARALLKFRDPADNCIEESEDESGNATEGKSSSLITKFKRLSIMNALEEDQSTLPDHPAGNPEDFDEDCAIIPSSVVRALEKAVADSDDEADDGKEERDGEPGAKDVLPRPTPPFLDWETISEQQATNTLALVPASKCHGKSALTPTSPVGGDCDDDDDDDGNSDETPLTRCRSRSRSRSGSQSRSPSLPRSRSGTICYPSAADYFGRDHPLFRTPSSATFVLPGRNSSLPRRRTPGGGHKEKVNNSFAVPPSPLTPGVRLELVRAVPLPRDVIRPIPQHAGSLSVPSPTLRSLPLVSSPFPHLVRKLGKGMMNTPSTNVAVPVITLDHAEKGESALSFAKRVVIKNRNSAGLKVPSFHRRSSRSEAKKQEQVVRPVPQRPAPPKPSTAAGK
ncbi:hypothetical protein F5Y16DRAFT_405290 [Xylariaceae sp. FL0255]|nr:hypothetical protein F5Y16DRAFT_405290 [Xylariaceae sp. FL0255]